MSSQNALVVLGNRPQFIKHAALARAWSEGSFKVQQIIVDTGQHYDHALAGIFMDELSIPAPDYALGVGSASHAEQLARMLPPLEEIMLREKPSSVILYGDTNSTLAGSLVASKLHIPIAHIEAGLRSFDLTMPEEVNRVMTDHVSKMLFAPTDQAVENLKREGIVGDRVHRVGDVMCDIALAISSAADERRESLFTSLKKHSGLQIDTSDQYGVVTIHRASNTENDQLEKLVEALTEVSKDIPLIFPVHPRTEAAAERAGLHVDLTSIENLYLVPPLGYIDMTSLLRGASIALTDSGGLQKEALIHGVPCVTLRDRTEWVETVDVGWNILAHNDPDKIIGAVEEFSSKFGLTNRSETPPNLYGSGDAATQILEVIERHANAEPHLGL